jgi:predicted ribosome quality control (RQC) complex YloA/Tae2 family protein
MPSQGRPYRSLSVSGFEVLVGKGDAANDDLTFGVADPLDFWLHVAGVPGSHVVVRNPDGLETLPQEVLERAAQLAAWHSKARAARGKIEVHACRVADVSKPRGFARGEVRLERWESLRVYPRARPGGG